MQVERVALELARLQVEVTLLAPVVSPLAEETSLEPASETVSVTTSQLAPRVAVTTVSRPGLAAATASELVPQATGTKASRRPAPSGAATRSEPATEPWTATARRRAPAAPTRPALSKRRRRPSCSRAEDKES